MVIKRIFIKAEIEHSKAPHRNFSYKFYLRSRHIFNFIERECLRKLKQVAGYDTISIELRYGFESPYMQRTAEVVYLNVLRITLPFNLEEYRQLSTMDEYYAFIEQTLIDAFEVVGDRFNLPSHEILESYHNFLLQGGENTWTLLSKVLDKEGKLKIQLKGRLTESNFILESLLYKGKTLIDSQAIFTGDPDELIFSKIAKEVHLHDGSIVISGKNGIIKRFPVETETSPPHLPH
ncbi:hypothetical protein HMPREF1556_01600 [Porphyromonas sp. oral taxon 278 str. W7784]|jgi:hypothetical protein|uniref:hypothetical protein n=1 Tax=Porphyromonas sp. oral taxon 278 TaxID=712437 RepID=UPI0003AD3EC4|nr:hypothetical protein [Porphyromonas sp. oral taxon 278]ERJ70332.1 hypothetical protein HMPREF1556_01600 [Porphyromonas sp. oral taxon 278 str. W7784]